VTQLTGTEGGIRYIDVAPVYGSPAATYLLLHGLGGSLEQWNAVIGRLGEESRTIAIDIPGFGESRTVLGNFDLEIAVEQILRFCQSKGVVRGILVSHSVGCVVAARLATIAPSMFTRVIFVSGALVRASEIAQHPGLALSNPRLGIVVAAQFLAGVLPIPRVALRAIASSSLLMQFILWPFVAHPAEILSSRLVETLTEGGSPSVMRILFTAKSIDYFGIISAVTQPVDLIWGSEDRLIDSEDIVRTRQMVNVTREHKIDRCGHWPWLENPPELISFLTSWSIDGTSEAHDS
jgi:pimeloyl-ACP methyl ester carboxylesterase